MVALLQPSDIPGKLLFKKKNIPTQPLTVCFIEGMSPENSRNEAVTTKVD